MMLQRSTAFSKKPNSNKKDFLVKMFIYMENCGGNYHLIGSLRNVYNSARVNGDTVISRDRPITSYDDIQACELLIQNEFKYSDKPIITNFILMNKIKESDH